MQLIKLYVSNGGKEEESREEGWILTYVLWFPCVCKLFTNIFMLVFSLFISQFLLPVAMSPNFYTLPEEKKKIRLFLHIRNF